MVSGIVTAVLLLVFVVGWVWAWSPRRSADFEEASRLPLDDGLSVVTKNREDGR